MSVGSVASGTQTIGALNTEYTLESSPISGAGAYVLRVDLSALSGVKDALEVRVKTRAIASGSLSAVVYDKPAGPQTLTVVDYGPVAIDGVASDRISFSLKQTGGTVRSFSWNILKIG